MPPVDPDPVPASVRADMSAKCAEIFLGDACFSVIESAHIPRPPRRHEYCP